MKKLIIKNSNFYLRIVLFLAFLGHGLVSLNFSPSYILHYSIIDSINFLDISTHILLKVHACFDIILAFLIIFNFRSNIFLYSIITYLILIGFSSLVFYWNTTGSIFGISEFIRRMPWIFFVLFVISDNNQKPKYNYIRIGLSFAFIAHGLASLGFMGLNQGHIELALKIMSAEEARNFVIYSGVSDTILGIMMLQSIFTKKVALISVIWISFIVYLSCLNAWPDAIFRTGFLLTAFYIYFDERTFTPKLIDYEKK